MAPSSVTNLTFYLIHQLIIVPEVKKVKKLRLFARFEGVVQGRLILFTSFSPVEG